MPDGVAGGFFCHVTMTIHRSGIRPAPCSSTSETCTNNFRQLATTFTAMLIRKMIFQTFPCLDSNRRYIHKCQCWQHRPSVRHGHTRDERNGAELVADAVTTRPTKPAGPRELVPHKENSWHLIKPFRQPSQPLFNHSCGPRTVRQTSIHTDHQAA